MLRLVDRSDGELSWFLRRQGEASWSRLSSTGKKETETNTRLLQLKIHPIVLPLKISGLDQMNGECLLIGGG